MKTLFKKQAHFNNRALTRISQNEGRNNSSSQLSSHYVRTKINFLRRKLTFLPKEMAFPSEDKSSGSTQVKIFSYTNRQTTAISCRNVRSAKTKNPPQGHLSRIKGRFSIVFPDPNRYNILTAQKEESQHHATQTGI